MRLTSARCAGAGAGRSGPAPVHLGGARRHAHHPAGSGHGAPAPPTWPRHSTHRSARPWLPHPVRGADASTAALPGRGAQGTPRRRRRRCCCCRCRCRCIPGECGCSSSSSPSASSRLSAQRLRRRRRRRPRPPPRRAALAKVRVRAPPGSVLHRPSRPAALPEPGPWHGWAWPPRLPARRRPLRGGRRARAEAGSADLGAAGAGDPAAVSPAPPAREPFTSGRRDARSGRPALLPSARCPRPEVRPRTRQQRRAGVPAALRLPKPRGRAGRAPGAERAPSPGHRHTHPTHSLPLAFGGELKQLWDSPRSWR